MDLQWFNSLALSLLLLLGTLAAFFMIVLLFIDTISFYRHRHKKNQPELSLLSPAPDSDGSQKTTPVKVGVAEGGERVEQGHEVLKVDKSGKSNRSRILARFMIFRSGKFKKESVKLAPPSAPILTESPADIPPVVSVPQPTTTDAAVADAPINSQAVLSDISATLPKSDQSPLEIRTTSEPTQKAPPPNGSDPTSVLKPEDQSAIETNEKPSEGDPEEKETGEGAPKIKLKPLASLEEARKIIETKTITKATESKAQPMAETDDVASLLGIAGTTGEKARAQNLESATPSKVAPETSDNNISVTGTVAEAHNETINQEADADSGGEKVDTSKPKRVAGEEDITAAEILMMKRGEDEILLLSKQLTELKSSLIQLEKKLKSLKEK